MKKKMFYVIILMLMCGALAFTSGGRGIHGSNVSNLWAGIGYMANGNRAQSAVISVVGAYESAMWGAVAGMAFGGPAGIAVGFGVSL